MKKLPNLSRRKVQAGGGDLVSFAPLSEERLLPLVATPARDDVAVDLVAWAAEHRAELEEKLRRHGGILFRGFAVDSVERFQELVAVSAGDPLEYKEKATPRSQVEGKVYTSTDYPPDQSIELHNESCYAQTFPRKIFFYCVTPAAEGGETPIADCRLAYRALDPAVRDRFADKGVTYQRTFSPGLGMDWRTTFGVDSREELERLCAEEGIEAEWLGEAPEAGGGSLVTRQTRPAVVDHPETGEPLWFNQAVAFHISTLDPDLRRQLEAEVGADRVPKTSLYGDGSAIAADDLAAVRRAYAAATVAFPWQRGDVLMLDNMLVAHGRNPYAGPRKIVVAMAQPHSLEEAMAG